MTPEDKKKECDRICGPYFSEKSRKEGLHETKSLDLDATDTCPILRDLWLTKRRIYA